MCRGVHVRSPDDDENLGQEVAGEERHHTDEDGAHVRRHGEGAPAHEVDGEEGHPGDHVDHEAEGDTLGLVVVRRQVLAHVAEGEAECTQQRHVRQLQGRAGRQRVAALQHHAVPVEGQVLGRLRGLDGDADHRCEEDDEGQEQNGALWPMVLGPAVVGWWQPGGELENADDLQGAHGDAGQAHGKAEHEQGLLEDAGQGGGLAKVAQGAGGGGSQRSQHQEAGAAAGGLGHRRVEVDQEDGSTAGGQHQADDQEEEQGHGERVVPSQQQHRPLQTALAVLRSPLVRQAVLTCGGIWRRRRRI